jgi:NADPH:quinone reductase-like Zn-dependent oxidoreductase
MAAGVNRPDLLQRQGLYNPPAGASPLPGLEVAGTVEQVGEQVTQWKTGDRVCALVHGGGYAEYVVVESSHCLDIPSSFTFVQAAALPETSLLVFIIST